MPSRTRAEGWDSEGAGAVCGLEGGWPEVAP